MWPVEIGVGASVAPADRSLDELTRYELFFAPKLVDRGQRMCSFKLGGNAISVERDYETDLGDSSADATHVRNRTPL